MKPVEIDGWCSLYHADNAEIVDVLRGHAPDAVITDPPYGIGHKSVGSWWKPGKGRPYTGRAYRERDFDSIHGDDKGALMAPWFNFAPQILFWGADKLRQQIPEGGRLLAWDKLAGMPSINAFTDVEYAWHSKSGASRLISHRWKGLVAWQSGGEEGFNSHPMQKPIRVMEWCIEECRLERGATILDPYMGSGTTAIAAFKRDMQFVGVEIDRRWFDAAVERIKRQTCNGPLFEKQQEPKQVALLA